VLVAAVVAYSGVVRPRLRTWGASRDEVGGAFPGDDLVPGRYRTTHAVTIASSPADVWPWLVQMGYRRGGWYSYDRLERAMGAGDFAEGGSAQRIVPELQELAVGDKVGLSEAGGLTVTGLEAPRSLVLHYRMDLITAAAATEGSRAVLDWTWAFVLEPVEIGCRLLVRVRAIPTALVRVLFPALEPVHFLMERRCSKQSSSAPKMSIRARTGSAWPSARAMAEGAPGWLRSLTSSLGRSPPCHRHGSSWLRLAGLWRSGSVEQDSQQRACGNTPA
jgi:hypothetical protein